MPILLALAKIQSEVFALADCRESLRRVQTLAPDNAEARCGAQVIDLRTGDAVHWLRIEGIVDELYDVITLPGVRSLMALGFKTDEIRRVISIDE